MKCVFVLLALVGVAAAGCPNSCSGHGTCKLGEICECQPRWLGPDCGLRECPYGVSWVTAAETGLAPGGASFEDIPSVAGGAFPRDDSFLGGGGRHPYTECSSKGSCDRSSGECQCFDGYAGKGCRRMRCPNDCSGNGMCMTNFEMNAEYHSVDPDSQMWDWNKATQCKCDPGYHGLDCSKRTCPVGDDPLTNCNAGTQVPDVQRLTNYIADNGDIDCTSVALDAACPLCDASGTPCSASDGTGICAGAGGNCATDATNVAADNLAQGGTDGYFTLQFTDAYGANFTTRPIYLSASPETYGTCSDGSSTEISACLRASATWTSKTAQDIELALEGLPNFAVPNVTVSVDMSSCVHHCNDNTYAVTFLDDANAGMQSLLQCSYTEHESQDHAAAAPRFAGPESATLMRACTASHITDTIYPPSQGYAYKDAVACSGRGDCDEGSGTCNCWEGFTGEACHEQTVFF